MDKKPLIVVCICAVVLLVMASLGNVVGYQSVKSTVNDSPLFQTKTLRATNQQQNILTSQYLGMGKGNELYGFIPSRNYERILLQKALKRLQGMDDVTFTKFLENALHIVMTQDKYKDVNVPQLIFTLHQLKENPKAFEQYLANNNSDLTTNDYRSVAWFPGCILLNIGGLIWIIIVIFLVDIIFHTTLPSCEVAACPHLYS